MYWSPSILGKTTVAAQAARARVPVLVLGADHFFKPDFAGIECFNFAAAANLSKVIAESKLVVRNTADLFNRIDPGALVLPRLGAVSLAALGAAFEVKHLGGEKPLEAWMLKHSKEKALVTFSTVKARRPLDAKAARTERLALKRRKDMRRSSAHRLRVDRFSKRRGAA